jgi:hypothetical protein
MSIGCCADRRASSEANDVKPKFDQEIGRLERTIVLNYGEPKDTITKKARELGGELRSALKSRVLNDDVEVKEFYYKTGKGERIFWLTKQATGEWKVISDVEIPAGVVF